MLRLLGAYKNRRISGCYIYVGSESILDYVEPHKFYIAIATTTGIIQISSR